MRFARLSVAFFFQICLLYRSIGEEVLYEQGINPYPFQIIVPVNVGGQVLSFLFDTGASSHMLDSAKGNLLQTYLGKGSLRGLGPDGGTSYFEAPELRIGKWKLPHDVIGLTDCAGFRRGLGVDIRGFLGIKAIKQTAVEVNFDKKQFRVLAGFQRETVPAAIPRISLQPSATTWKVFTIKAALEGEDVELAVDTGTNECIGLKHERFEKLMRDGVIKEETESRVVSRETVTGQHKTANGKFTRGKLLGIELKDLPVQDTGKLESLGMLFLINFNFILDFQGGEFFFQKRNAEPPIRHNLMLGSALTFLDGHCRVLALAPNGGPAQNAGIKPGDEILKLGPVSGKDICLSSIYELCLREAGHVIEVEFFHAGENQAIKVKLTIGRKQFVYPPR